MPGLPTWTVLKKDNPVQTQDQVWVRWDWQKKTFDDEGRVVMHPAKLKREPFGEDQKPAGSETKPEDF